MASSAAVHASAARSSETSLPSNTAASTWRARVASPAAGTVSPCASDCCSSAAAVCSRVANAHSTARVGAVHRVGELAVGDLAVVVAVAAPHRAEAFAACRELIDTLKHEVPIWKHQVFADGDDEWVGIA